jgi:hypothetical protein
MYYNIILCIHYIHEKTIKANIVQSTDIFAGVLCSSDIQLCGDDHAATGSHSAYYNILYIYIWRVYVCVYARSIPMKYIYIIIITFGCRFC